MGGPAKLAFVGGEGASPLMRIDADWVSEHRLADGTVVQVRPIRPSDADELRRSYERLSPRSRYLRFLSPAPQLTDEVVRYLTEVDGVDHFALVALRVSHDLKTETGLGVARFFRLPDTPEVAEVAVTVVDEMQGKGLGRLLTRLVAEAARERGIRAFRAEVAVENDAMRGLLAAAGATVVKQEAGTLIFDVPVGSPEGAAAHDTPLSRLLALAATFVAALRAAVPDGAPAEPPQTPEPPAPADADSPGRSRPSGE
jgi:RimJ/RimL family protein N-acetyltransferase